MNRTPSGKRRFGSAVTWIIVAFNLLLLYGLLFPVVTDRPTPTTRRNAQARNDAAQLVTALKFYYTEFHQFPTGSHADILRALRGDNPLKIVFFEPSPKQVSPAGELLDPWGVPYHIDTSEVARPRVHSTGRDKHDDAGAKGSDDIRSWR